MFSKRFYKILGQRVESMKWGIGTYYSWDKKTEHLKMAQPFRIYNMYSQLQGGVCLVLMHALQMYLKTHPNDIDEDGRKGPKDMTLKEFATLMMEGGILLATLCLCFLNYVFLHRLDVFMVLYNELLDYNKNLSERIEAGELTLTGSQTFVIRGAEIFLYGTMVVSALIPFGVLLAMSAEIEPHHQLIVEWLEIEVALKLVYLPFICIMFLAIYGAGTTVCYMSTLIILYYITTTTCLEALLPEEMQRSEFTLPHRCNLVTSGFGTLPDMEVILLYRTQQLLNILMNTFFKSVLIAFHHCGCLAALVVLFVFVIRYGEIISEQGPMGYVIIFSCLMVPLVLIYSQSKMAGAVVDMSDDFAFSGIKLVPRRFMFRKFTRSCTTFYIQVTYPFYTVNKETFTEFAQQAQDYSMELLLW